MTYEAARDVIAHHSALSSTNRLALLDFLREHPGQARELFRVDAAYGFLPAHKDGEILRTAAFLRNFARWLITTGRTNSAWAHFHATRTKKSHKGSK
jgi:hypothetical protein